MTTLARLRRLRRPVAVLLLVCMMSCFACPLPSRAVDPATVGLALMATAAVTPIVQRYGPQMAYQAARVGGWTVTKGKELAIVAGTFASAGAGKLIGFTKQAYAKGKDLLKWAKNHPRDAADLGLTIAEAGADWYQATKDAGLPHTADALKEALGGTGLQGNPGVGDIVEVPGCGRVVIQSSVLGPCDECRATPPENRQTCTTATIYFVKETHPSCSAQWNNTGKSYGCYKYQYTFDLSGPSEPSPQGLPDNPTDQQSVRIIEEIEKKLQEHKEAMEKELDELLKRNLEDIDWPKFDNEAAQQYMAQRRAQELQNKIDETQEELERKRREREEQCQQQQGNCQNQCCDTGCDESRLANRLDQLRDRLDDLNQQQEDRAIQEYSPSVVPTTELKKIDFQPIVDLKGSLMSKFPFNMLQLIPSAFEVLTAEPIAPYWDANLGEMGGTHRVDFAVLDGLASFIRLVISWLCYIGAVFCCLKIWSRF